MCFVLLYQGLQRCPHQKDAINVLMMIMLVYLMYAYFISRFDKNGKKGSFLVVFLKEKKPQILQILIIFRQTPTQY